MNDTQQDIMTTHEEDTHRVITIDSDKATSDIIASALEFSSVHVFHSQIALRQLEKVDPLGIFVSVQHRMTPEDVHLVQQVHEKKPFCPIFVMTNIDSLHILPDAFSQGVDDVIFRPLKNTEIKGRFKARYRDKQKLRTSNTISLGELKLDTHNNNLVKNGVSHSISHTNAKILGYLMKLKGVIVKREELKKEIWPTEKFPSENALDRKMSEIRSVLTKINSKIYVRTIYGTGFVLESQ